MFIKIEKQLKGGVNLCIAFSKCVLKRKLNHVFWGVVII